MLFKLGAFLYQKDTMERWELLNLPELANESEAFTEIRRIYNIRAKYTKRRRDGFA